MFLISFDYKFNRKRENNFIILDLPVNHTSVEHPWFKDIKDNVNSKYKEYYRISKKDDKNFKAQFVNAFRLTKNKFLTSEYVRNKNGELKHTSKNVSDVTSLSNNIINQWFFNLKQLDLQPYQLKEIEKSLMQIDSKLKKLSGEDLSFFRAFFTKTYDDTMSAIVQKVTIDSLPPES